jgi:hypothetical protein
MVYEAPKVEVIGPANEEVQAFIGPRYDGDGLAQSQMCFMTELEVN